jgi:hypothetical protein
VAYCVSRMTIDSAGKLIPPVNDEASKAEGCNLSIRRVGQG